MSFFFVSGSSLITDVTDVTDVLLELFACKILELFACKILDSSFISSI
jgi:hypothetical protein